MSFWFWMIWAPLLFCQNAIFTWVSRSRNSGSVKWHGVASIFGNIIFFIIQIFLITTVWDFITGKDWISIALAIGFYTFFTTLGSISAHKFLLWFEKGRQQVGSR